MCSCENESKHPALLVKEFEKLGVLSFINYVFLYTHKQPFSVSLYGEMHYFPSTFIVVKMLVCLNICCHGLFHAKREKKEGKSSPKETSISSEKENGLW